MAPQFNETAPGVHTTTLIDPKTQRPHNVAIIESSNAWQLFIDGELKTRDLPSFKAAVAAAQKQITSRRSSTVVRVATALVAVSVAGAATIGLAKAISPLLDGETAIAKIASTSKDTEVSQRFARVAAPRQASQTEASVSVPSVVGTSASDPAAAKSATATKIAAKSTPLASIAETVVAITPPATSRKATTAIVKRSEAEEPATSIIAQADDKGTSTSDTAPIGLRPLQAPTPKDLGAEVTAPAQAETAGELAPVIIKRRPKPVSPAAPIENDSEIAADNDPPEALPTEPLATGDATAFNDAPPLPARAPALAAPVVRSTAAPADTRRLKSILAELEVEANEREYKKKVRQPKPAPRIIKRRTSTRKKAVKRSHRINKRTDVVTHHRKIRRKRVYAARSYHRPQERRMVCFAHTCRFR